MEVVMGFDPDVPTKEMIDETSHAGLLHVRFHHIHVPETALLIVYLPALPAQSERVVIAGKRYEVMFKQWIFTEGAFYPYTLQVHISLREL